MDEVILLAKAVEDAVFRSLLNALNEPEKEDHWFRHANRLERKFINQHGMHPSYFTQKVAA